MKNEELDYQNIVPINQNYTYEMMQENIQTLKRAYPFLEIGSIGQSVLKKELPYIRIGFGPKEVLYHGGIHANEWITSVLLMKYVENFCKAYITGGYVDGYPAQKIFEQTSLYLIPMMNPDTINLVTGAISKNTKEYRHYQTISMNFPEIPFPDGWKANYNGVDLNLQFPAGWNQAKEIKFAQGYNKPAPRDYVGDGPLTEPEALAIYNFTLAHNFRLTISYHTQGKEIYWQFLNFVPPNAYEIGQTFARLSGYSLVETPYLSSFAGYKDWYIQTYNRPGYTVEAGLR